MLCTTGGINRNRYWFDIPSDKVEEALRVMESLGASNVEEDDIDFDNCPSAEAADSATMLRVLRRRENLKQTELAQLTGISQRDISKMENGKISIGKERAKKLAKQLNTNYKVFL